MMEMKSLVKEFKVIHKNKIEAIMKFGVNHELTVISAQGNTMLGKIEVNIN